jgi:hypothetical protein
MLQIVWRLGTQINNHVKDRTIRAANVLRLHSGRILEVQAAQCPALRVEADTCLCDRWFQSIREKLICTEHTVEMTAFVFSSIKINRMCARKRGFREDHFPEPQRFRFSDRVGPAETLAVNIPA